jgi:nifR3 family TIM-barrel protein
MKNNYSQFFFDKLKSNPFILAPMDEVTDLGFRKLCEELGSNWTTTELTNVRSIIAEGCSPSRYEKGFLKTNVIQLFGNVPKDFLLAAKKVEKQADWFDINFGCPSTKVTGNNCGSMLLKDPKNVYEIIKILVDNLNIPITAKIRLGYEKVNALSVAKEIERAGASCIVIHGRTAKQKYGGLANWEEIKKIYNELKIPVIGNGDIKNTNDIDKYLNKYCDGIMIGRSAIGNPLIFKEFLDYYTKNYKK